MFRIAAADETWTYPVTIQVPAGGGATGSQEFVASFRLAAPEVMDALQSNKGIYADIELLEHVVQGWEGIAAPDGKPLAYNQKNLALLTAIPYWRAPVIEAYFRFAAGLPAKNSPEPSPTG